MARSQLEEGYYGDLLVYSDYTNPLKGKFDLTRRDVQSQYPQIGWFAVDTITYTEGIVGITLRFEQKGPNRPAVRGYFSWNSVSMYIPLGRTCGNIQTLWRPLAYFLPHTDSYLYIEDKGSALQVQYTSNITVSLFNSAIFVEISLPTGVVKGSFLSNSPSLSVGCYDEGVCWGENCHNVSGWFQVERLERQGDQLLLLEMRFEQRKEERVQWRGALKWGNPA